MSRKQKIKHMSSDELKSKLYAHFQKTGSFDHLKAQLRGQLVSELFKVSEPIESDKLLNSSDVDKCLLPLQVCNWLVYDHLSRQDYQYSLSTYVTEAQLPYPERFLTAGDILQLLGLSHSTAEFETINKLYIEKNELGCLHSLLLAIIKAMFNVPNKDSSFNQNAKVDISNKKKTSNSHEELDHNSAINTFGAMGDASFPDELLKSKQESLNKSLTSNDDVKSAEESFHEQLQCVKEESERAVQKLRHKLLEELENLHSQERKMQLEIEHTKSELRKEQNKLYKEKEMLKEKELLMEKELTNKLEMKLRDAESDFAMKLHLKDKEIESLKMKLSEKDQRLVHIETELANENDVYTLTKRELEDSRHMYKIIQDKYSSVLDENTKLLKQFESMSDYSILKEELASKSKEVTRLHNEIKDIHQRSEAERKKYVQTVRNLEDNLNMKEPQLIQAKQELEHVKSTLNSEEAIWNKERKKLEKELNELKEHYKTVIERMDGREEDIQDLQKTIQILNYKLTNNVINTSKSGSSRSYKHFHNATDISQMGKPQTLFTKRNTFLQQPSEKHDDSSLKFQFLSDAKSRFSKLKQEEDAVQEKYSFIISTIPENNKQYDSNFETYNMLSLSKSNEDYQTSFSKSVPFNSAFSFDNLSKNKMQYSKNPYSLSEVKRMVSHSLLSYKSNNQAGLQTISNLDTSPKVPNMISSKFNDPLKMHSHYSLNKYVSPELIDETHTLSTRRESTSNKISVPDSSQKRDFQEKNLNENQETALSPVQSLSEKLTVDKSYHLEKEIENIENTTKSSLSENIYNLSISTNAPPAGSERFEITSQKVSDQNLEPEKSQLLLSQSNQIQNEALKKSENNPEQSASVFINLDAVWKRKSSFPSLPIYRESAITDKLSTHAKSDSNPLVSDSRTLFSSKENISQSNLQSKAETNDQSKELSIEPAKNVDDERMKPGNSMLQVENTSKIVESTSSIEDKSELRNEEEHSKNYSLDKIENVEDEEHGSVKSAEKGADSLSELSEIHLSCGSEPEQQKEDSDAW